MGALLISNRFRNDAFADNGVSSLPSVLIHLLPLRLIEEIEELRLQIALLVVEWTGLLRVHNNILSMFVWAGKRSNFLRIKVVHGRFSFQLAQDHAVGLELLLVVEVEVLLRRVFVNRGLWLLGALVHALQIVIQIVVGAHLQPHRIWKSLSRVTSANPIGGQVALLVDDSLLGLIELGFVGH